MMCFFGLARARVFKKVKGSNFYQYLLNYFLTSRVMFKFSRESKRTFLALLFIPFVWIALNHSGYLNYLKTKSVDWRKQFRGEISQDLVRTPIDLVNVEGNKTVPRIPKVVYVNFDAKTLAMDGVGERPWDRAFFRDTASTLLIKGKARSIGFDFGFTPKSMSSMVPAKNSFRSDQAMGQLVDLFPNQVVLGCLYSGVQTPFVKPANARADAPFFSGGYSENDKQFHYPESPTYPLQNYKNGKYIGLLGSFSVPPFNAVDDIPRWVPLWFPSGGKAHAYNLLGGKQNVLKFELPIENRTLIEKQELNLSKFLNHKTTQENKIKESEGMLLEGKKERARIEGDITKLKNVENRLVVLNEEITTLSNTLKVAPALASNLKPQIDEREKQRSLLSRQVLLAQQKESWTNIFFKEEREGELAEIEEVIANFKNTLLENPNLSAVINPQIQSRITKRDELTVELETLCRAVTKPEIKQSLNLLRERCAHLGKEFQEKVLELTQKDKELNKARDTLAGIDQSVKEIESSLLNLTGLAETELVEKNNTLRLIYKRGQGDFSAGQLVDSLPNEVPLYRNDNIFTLGLSTLLAYYGIGSDQVEISENKDELVLYSLSGDVLSTIPMEEGQWVEVNWFSSWKQHSDVEKLIADSKKFYGNGDFESYLSTVPKILRLTLERVNGIEIETGDKGLAKAMTELGLETELIEITNRLLSHSLRDSLKVPSHNDLMRVLDGISYYFVPLSIKSEFNPMCGMADVLNYGRFHDEVSDNLVAINEWINRLRGPEGIEGIERKLKAEPGNEELLAQKDKLNRAIEENIKNLAVKKEEMAQINEFFRTFENSIVLIGPEEKTFQDLAPTPFDAAAVPKVSVHGNLIKTLTHQEYLHRLPIKIDHLATFGVCLVMGFLAVYQGKRASLVQSGGILLLLLYVYLGFETFSQSHVIWPITVPACAGISTSFIGLAAMVVIEQKAKGRLKGMFGSYVSSDLVEEMVASGEEPSLGGEETEITAFFSDVQAFSSFSELLTPTGLVDLMNEYLTAMTNILQEERGTLDKYIGDAIVAMYGAPIPMKDHAYQAVRTSILMQQKQIELRNKWVPEVEKWGKCHGLVTQMQTRIGCNTGTATVGNMGALDRFNYTMMGDMVNLAARCESGAKAYGAYIMVTEETKLASEKMKDDIAFRYLDKIVVKGRSQPVAMYEPTGFMSELTQETQDCLDCFQQGIDKYLAQDWMGALNLFEKAKEMEPNKPGVTPGVKDNPSMILIDRCKVMMDNPPGDDWDGVYVMTTK